MSGVHSHIIQMIALRGPSLGESVYIHNHKCLLSNIC